MIKHPFLDGLREQIRQKNDNITPKRIEWIRRNPYYYKQFLRSLKFIIEEGAKVLHLRSSIGFVLDALKPKLGVGVEDSPRQVEEARERYPHLRFVNQNPEDLQLEQGLTFDYVLISSVEDIVDLKAVLDALQPYCLPHTRVVLVSYNYLWNPLVRLAEWTRMKIPQKLHNWLSTKDLDNLLSLTGHEVVNAQRLILLPFGLPLLAYIFNRFLARLPFFRYFTMLRLTVARKMPIPSGDYSVSVVIPCKNEAGNIEDAVTRIPHMGKHTEIIFCDDKSTDGTPDIVRQMMLKFPEKDIKLYDGPGISKARNVWVGFDNAQGDILMILDADLTVIPEELPYFYEAIATGRGEFINGSRLVYPMHGNAMPFFNTLGNKFFSIYFSYILNTTIKDTLCGTKVVWRRDYQRMKPLFGHWGLDRWGDYDIIFSASKRNLKHLDLPVHYYERVYGETKMTGVLKNGWIMLRMSTSALFKIKFH